MRLLFLFGLAYATALHTLENSIEKYINKDIPPCDDYYGHICSNFKREDMIVVKFHEEYKKLMQEHKLEEAERAATLIENLIEAQPEQENRTYLIEKCESSPELRLMLLDVFPDDMDYVSCEQLIGHYLNDSDVLDPKQAFTMEYIRNVGSYIHYVTKHKKEISQIETTIEFLIDAIKEYYIRELEKSRWLRNFSDSAIHIMKTARYIPTLPYKKHVDFAKLITSFNNCLEMTANNSRVISSMCFSEASENVFGYTMSRQISMLATFSIPNALMDLETNHILVIPSLFVPKASEELKNTILAFVIGHELGHAIFAQIPEQPKQSKCLINNAIQTCKIFDYGAECRSGELTYQEDAPDFVAFKALMHIQRTNPGLFTSSFETLMKIYAGFHCTTRHDHPELEEHSMGRIRTNGVLRQLTQFEHYFGCNRTSPMVAERKCFLIGQGSRKSLGSGVGSIFD